MNTSLMRPPWPAKLISVVGVGLVFAGLGATATFLKDSPDSARSGSIHTYAQTSVDPDSAQLARLKDYTRSISTKAQSTKPATQKQLPDVKTMIRRLAARLETTPDDVEGWRMLGWSYFNMTQYKQAAAAYAKAIELDPSSTDLKSAYDMAKAKVSESESLAAAPTDKTVAHDANSKEETAEKSAAIEAMSRRQSDPAIRSMVDGLAKRLARAPRDVAGWTRLMRSRVVLGEKTVAVTAFRTALDVFKDDSEASNKLTATAIDLGLKTD